MATWLTQHRSSLRLLSPTLGMLPETNKLICSHQLDWIHHPSKVYTITMSGKYDNSETVEDLLIEFFSNEPEDLCTATKNEYDDGVYTKVAYKKKTSHTSIGGWSGRGCGGRDVRGGREGWGGRGPEPFESKNPFKDSPPLPKPMLNGPKGKILHETLIQEKSLPVTFDDFKVFTVREKAICIIYVASVRGKDTGYFKGTRTEFPNRLQNDGIKTCWRFHKSTNFRPLLVN